MSQAARRKPAKSTAKPKSQPKRAGSKAAAPAKRAKSRAPRIVLVGGSRAARKQRAHALATTLEGHFLAVDLSRVVGKYIGETEKNLARLFELAAATDAVLLFDEADALFGKRTTVKDSHDRYANQEVSYLLQRIEQHPGHVLLATNKRTQLDEVLAQRLGFVAKTVRAR